MALSFRRKINLGLVFSVLLILVFAGYAIFVSNQSESFKNQLKQSYQIIDQIREINDHLKDMEIFKQEFLFFGKDKSWQAYYDKFASIQELLEKLEIRSEQFQDTAQIENIKKIKAMIRDKGKCDEECMQIRKTSKDSAKIMKYILDREDENFLQDMRNILEFMEQKERFALHERLDRDRFNSQQVSILIILGSPFTVFIYIILIYVINNDIKLRAIQENQLQLLSVTDELTGLYNRRGFLFNGNKIFKESNREKRKMFLYFIDMDGLKIINDTLGHKMGDEAIQAMANILKQSFRLTDIIARMGGDEFAIVVVDSHVSSDTVIKRLKRKMEDFNSQTNLPFKLSASIGFEEYDPEKHTTMEEMVAVADEKMYHHKSKSKKNRN